MLIYIDSYQKEASLIRTFGRVIYHLYEIVHSRWMLWRGERSCSILLGNCDISHITAQCHHILQHRAIPSVWCHFHSVIVQNSPSRLGSNPFPPYIKPVMFSRPRTYRKSKAKAKAKDLGPRPRPRPRPRITQGQRWGHPKAASTATH